MRKLTQQGQQLVNDLSNRYGLSHNAVQNMLDSVINGGGTMAQFNIPELGGSGQWMKGGMTMVGDMFNNGLKATVDNLCGEISSFTAQQQAYEPQQQQNRMNNTSMSFANTANNWWPEGLGTPSSTGAQNNIRYAVFPASRRLAVEANGRVTVYDTLDHNIGGVSQQQGGGSSLTFTSQYGVVNVNSLPVVNNDGSTNTQSNQSSNDQQKQTDQTSRTETQTNQQPGSHSQDDIISMIERLGKLKEAGVLTEQEFNEKKTVLLNKL